MPSAEKRTPSTDLYTVLPSSTINLLRDLQPAKEEEPSFVRVDGMVKVLNPQSAKAVSSMKVIPSGRTTFVNL